MTIDFDDFGVNKVISDMCQSHDCRDKLDELHYFNPQLKVTLFAIPAYMTIELADWCRANSEWIELAVHGFYHTSNYECEKWTYSEMEHYIEVLYDTWPDLFVQGFKAPGWQISTDVLQWLKDSGWWVSDQSYNDDRRPEGLPAYVNNGGEFRVYKNGMPSDIIPASHHHTWDCVGNGIYEQFSYLKDLLKQNDTFKFISEIISETNTSQERPHDHSRSGRLPDAT